MSPTFDDLVTNTVADISTHQDSNIFTRVVVYLYVSLTFDSCLNNVIVIIALIRNALSFSSILCRLLLLRVISCRDPQSGGS